MRSRLLQCGLRGNDLENVMVKLIEQDFLNEERFAIAFAGGKFRMKNWGRKKIEQQLKAKGVSGYCLTKAMKQINDTDYRKSLMKLLEKKAASLKDKNLFIRKQRLSNFLIGKGYEPEIVYGAISTFYSDGEMG